MSTEEETVQIPCNYCNNTLSVTAKAKANLMIEWGVCADCKEAIRNAQICEVCHHKLFKDCDWKKDESKRPCDHKVGLERLNHIEWGVHVCNTHYKRYQIALRAMYQEDYDE